MEVKNCSKCNDIKLVTEFGRQTSSKDGLKPWCKQCNKAYRKQNPEMIKTHLKKYADKNKEKRRLSTAAWREKEENRHKPMAYAVKRKEKDPDHYWKRRIITLYGIDHTKYEEILNSQNRKCFGCGKDQNESKKRFSIDHDHLKTKGESGFIRGILCCNCNFCIAHTKDSPDTLIKLAEYIENRS